MAIAQRTPTSGTLAASATGSITLPASTTTGDFLVVGIANAGTTNANAPTGWTKYGPYSAGTGQSVSVFTAPYSAGLTLSFTNVASVAAWVCDAYFEAGNTLQLDGTPVAASSTSNNATMTTGAPVTGSAGDYEVLVYAWTSTATQTAASGMTVDAQQVNGTTIKVSLGHNNTNPLGAAVTCTAFAPTLSASNTRKTGVGVLLQSVPPRATSQIGALDVNVDLRSARPETRAAGLGLNVDALLSHPAGQVGGLGLQIDYAYPQGVQYGGLVLDVDMQPVTSRRVGTLGLMLDYVPSLVGTGIGWGGGAFQSPGGPYIEVRWTTNQFATAGGIVVGWSGEEFVPA